MTRVIDTFSYYSYLAMRTAHCSVGGDLLYLGCGLAGEAGEIANELKKVARDDSGVLTDDRRIRLMGEIGDTLWYLNALACAMGVSLEACATGNIEKLEARYGLLERLEPTGGDIESDGPLAVTHG